MSQRGQSIGILPVVELVKCLYLMTLWQLIAGTVQKGFDVAGCLLAMSDPDSDSRFTRHDIIS